MTMKQIARNALLLMGLVLGSTAQAGKVTYVYTDPQGTPLAEADASGNITATFDYTPYGVPVQGLSGSPNGPGYTGHVNDPDTGLVYMQARYYDPETGSFLSIDPDRLAAGNVFNFNAYAYADESPIGNVDPTGRHTASEGDDACMGNSECIAGSGAEGGASDIGVSTNTNALSYKSLAGNYPSHEDYPTDPLAPNTIWSMIGGHVLMNAWSSEVGGDGSHLPNNSCAIRLSYALNASGLAIPKIRGATISGADGRQYFYRVKDLQKFLSSTLGTPRRLAGGSFSGPEGETGIISFNIPFQDASGHFTLWDGSRVIDYHEPYKAWPKPTSVLFWSIK